MAIPFRPPIDADRRTPLGLEQRLAARFRRVPLGDDARLVVGFSGGPDSLALGAALGAIAGSDRVVLAHVDHGLRADSRADAAAAADLAAALGLPFRLATLPAGLATRAAGSGVEEAARRERYLALARIVRSEQAAALALAHHRDDQAETVLLHLLRGAGLTGAAGMAEWTQRVVPWWAEVGSNAPDSPAVSATRIAVWRPVLSEPRAALVAYVDGLGLAPLHDPTNDDPAWRRNLVRRQILPEIERAVPGAAAALARFAALAAEDDAALDAVARAALAAARDGDALAADRLRPAPVAIRRRAIRSWLAESAPGVEVSAERTEAVLGLLEPRRGGRRVEIGGGWVASERRGVVALARGQGGEEQG